MSGGKRCKTASYDAYREQLGSDQHYKREMFICPIFSDRP